MKKTISGMLAFYLAACIVLASLVVTMPLIGSKRYMVEARGGIIHETFTESIVYSVKEDDEEYSNPYRLPLYYSPYTNTCAVTAGGVAIAYFDISYPNLIPNSSGFEIGTTYLYPAQGSTGSAVNNMFAELYEMTNSSDNGTTIPDFKSGMEEYVESKGYDLTMTDIYSNHLDFEACKTALEAGKLVTVFVDGFSVYDNEIRYDGYDTMTCTVVNGAHTLTAYGYSVIKYYDASMNIVAEYEFLLVQSGMPTLGLTRLRVDSGCTIDDAYVLDVN